MFLSASLNGRSQMIATLVQRRDIYPCLCRDKGIDILHIPYVCFTQFHAA